MKGDSLGYTWLMSDNDVGSPSSLVTMSQIAELAGVATATVRTWLARGKLPPPTDRFGQSPVWLRAEIVFWLRGRCAAELPPSPDGREWTTEAKVTLLNLLSIEDPQVRASEAAALRNRMGTVMEWLNKVEADAVGEAATT